MLFHVISDGDTTLIATSCSTAIMQQLSPLLLLLNLLNLPIFLKVLFYVRLVQSQKRDFWEFWNRTIYRSYARPGQIVQPGSFSFWPSLSPL